MNVFDIVGLASKVPYDLIEKLRNDTPKLERLIAISQEAAPAIQHLTPLAEEAEKIWVSLSPDITALLKAIGVEK